MAGAVVVVAVVVAAAAVVVGDVAAAGGVACASYCSRRGDVGEVAAHPQIWAAAGQERGTGSPGGNGNTCWLVVRVVGSAD